MEMEKINMERWKNIMENDMEEMVKDKETMKVKMEQMEQRIAELESGEKSIGNGKLEYESKVNEPDHRDSIEERVEKLEQLSKYKTLRTCQELASHGLTLSGIYEIDPDGADIGLGPIQVYCDFATNTTQIFHDKEEEIEIAKCGTVGCATYTMNYSAPKEQIDALKALSQSCAQEIEYKCFLAPLRSESIDHGYWQDQNGDNQIFYNGNHPGEHICSCGDTNSCVDSTIGLQCNCDSNNPTWDSDVGYITSKDLLPIAAFNYGPLEFEIEKANVTIGRLTCSGMTSSIPKKS